MEKAKYLSTLYEEAFPVCDYLIVEKWTREGEVFDYLRFMVTTSTCVLLEQTSIRDLRHLGVVTILCGIGSSLSTMAPQFINIKDFRFGIIFNFWV